jgi:hypothetical protein
MEHIKTKISNGITYHLYEGSEEFATIWSNGDIDKAKVRADFIVKAVNNHQKLVDALKYSLSHFRHVFGDDFRHGAADIPSRLQDIQALLDEVAK